MAGGWGCEGPEAGDRRACRRSHKSSAADAGDVRAGNGGSGPPAKDSVTWHADPPNARPVVVRAGRGPTPENMIGRECSAPSTAAGWRGPTKSPASQPRLVWGVCIFRLQDRYADGRSYGETIFFRALFFSVHGTPFRSARVGSWLGCGAWLAGSGGGSAGSSVRGSSCLRHCS